MKPVTCLVAIALTLLVSEDSGFALSDEKLNGQLLKLDMETRLEQTCDTEVMLRINLENRKLSVDKVIAYSFAEPRMKKDSITAPGAVFRSRGEWYHLSYACKTGPRHLDAHQLDYEIGPMVPRSKWRKHYLYD